MTTSTNAALAFVLASYAKPATVEVKEDKPVSKTRAKTAPKAKAPKAVVTGEQSAPKTTPSPNGGSAKGMTVEPGSLEAKGFLMMMRSAKSREEKILAIQAYCGYDHRGVFGTQEMRAEAKAKAELRPIGTTGPSRQEKREASRSAKGFVAGMPDNQRKIVMDLLAREKMAAEQRDEHVKIARTRKDLSWEERKLNLGLARLENERLASIRADIAKWI